MDLGAVRPAVVLNDKFPLGIAVNAEDTPERDVAPQPSVAIERRSLKLSTTASCRFGSDQSVRPFLRNFAGSALQRSTGIFFISWKGLIMECGEG